MFYYLGENIFEVGDKVSVSGCGATVVEVQKSSWNPKCVEGYVVEMIVDGSMRRVQCYKNDVKEW